MRSKGPFHTEIHSLLKYCVIPQQKEVILFLSFFLEKIQITDEINWTVHTAFAELRDFFSCIKQIFQEPSFVYIFCYRFTSSTLNLKES